MAENNRNNNTTSRVDLEQLLRRRRSNIKSFLEKNVSSLSEQVIIDSLESRYILSQNIKQSIKEFVFAKTHVLKEPSQVPPVEETIIVEEETKDEKKENTEEVIKEPTSPKKHKKHKTTPEN